MSLLAAKLTNDAFGSSVGSDDPLVTESVPRTVAETIETSNDPAARLALAEQLRLLAPQLAPYNIPASEQSLYVAGHRLYSDGGLADLDAALSAFESLSQSTSVLPLRIDALRMLGQIRSHRGEHAASAAAYSAALEDLAAFESQAPWARQAYEPLLLVGLADSQSYVGVGNQAVQTINSALASLTEFGRPHDQQTLLLAINIAERAADNPSGAAFIDRLLDNHPSFGFDDGTRIGLLFQQREMNGHVDGASTIEEFEFCNAILGDARYARNAAWFGVLLHQGYIAMNLGQYDAAIGIFDRAVLEIDHAIGSLAVSDPNFDLERAMLLETRGIGLLHRSHARRNIGATDAARTDLEHLRDNSPLYGDLSDHARRVLDSGL